VKVFLVAILNTFLAPTMNVERQICFRKRREHW